MKNPVHPVNFFNVPENSVTMIDNPINKMAAITMYNKYLLKIYFDNLD